MTLSSGNEALCVGNMCWWKMGVVGNTLWGREGVGKYSSSINETWERKRETRAHTNVYMNACILLFNKFSFFTDFGGGGCCKIIMYWWVQLLASQRWDFFMYYIPSCHPTTYSQLRALFLKSYLVHPPSPFFFQGAQNKKHDSFFPILQSQQTCGVGSAGREKERNRFG